MGDTQWGVGYTSSLNQPVEAVQPGPPIAGGNADVFIKKVSNGFIVNIGCKVLIAKTWEEVSEGLALYFKDSNAARIKYCQDEKPTKALKPRRK